MANIGCKQEENTSMSTKGFTLIELMIVVAMIAILVSIAFPIYQFYAIRARVTEGLVLSAAARSAIGEYWDTHNSLPSSSAQAHYTSPAATQYVSAIDIDSNAAIIITYTPSAGGGTIILAPTAAPSGGVITWDCRGGTLNGRYRPAHCRP